MAQTMANSETPVYLITESGLGQLMLLLIGSPIGFTLQDSDMSERNLCIGGPPYGSTKEFLHRATSFANVTQLHQSL